MRKPVGAVIAAMLLVSCGGSGGDSDRCQTFFDLEARLKPPGFNFDENNDGYLNAAERVNQDLNNDAIKLYESTKGSYADC
jgi:hypothetical protein